MIILNGLTLNGSLQWTERYTCSGVSQAVKVTLGGKHIVSSAPLSNGRFITLVASEETGWITKAQADSILAWAGEAGLVMGFTYHNELIGVPVVFRHNEPPAVELVPLIPKSVIPSNDYFTGTIKLMIL